MFLSLLQHLGPRWVAQRLRWKCERKFGLWKRGSPQRPWTDYAVGFDSAAWRTESPRLPIANFDRTYIAPQLEAWSIETGCSPSAQADAFAQGYVRIFSDRVIEVGQSHRWTQNLLTGRTANAPTHWSQISDMGSDDIKGVWELSRFTWAFSLVRAWLRDGEARHIELFWATLEDWMLKNPPDTGPNWMCGQEAALRLIAVTFATQAFRKHPSSTDARLSLVAQLAAATAARIEFHLDYALSQNNNHGISEAIGLLTVGKLWPKLEGAGNYYRQGISALSDQCSKLIGIDGGFSQHSTNYHRLLLHLLSWAEIVERTSGTALPVSIRERAIAATGFLSTLMESDGTVPRYGADDGADLFPLSGSQYDDFRPAVGVALLLFKGQRLPQGPWDETSLLLLGPLPETSKSSPQVPANFPDAGVFTLRHRCGTLFFRAPAVFRTRPSHADQLHVSLNWNGEWVTEDPGTFSYNAPGGWHGFAAAQFHNLVTINGQNPMGRISRFLWLPWTICKVRQWQNGFTASHFGYANFRTERSVMLVANGFIVVDRLTSLKKRTACCVLRWHGKSRAGLEQLSIACSMPSQEEYVTALPEGGEGWHSNHYGSKNPAWCRRITAKGEQMVFVTALGCTLTLSEKSFTVDGKEYPLE